MLAGLAATTEKNMGNKFTNEFSYREEKFMLPDSFATATIF